jgi:O-6-methylguanine DNA methyltransferase
VKILKLKTFMKLYKKELTTPLGNLIALASQGELFLLDFSDSKGLTAEIKQVINSSKGLLVQGESNLFPLLEEELSLYFQGDLQQFSIPLHLIGTDFQKRVWQELLKIPYGNYISYQEQAQRMGQPKAVRAVAGANGHNKIVILIPCHRVVGSNGTLTGYSCGLWRKQKLLEIEHISCDEKYRLCQKEILTKPASPIY